MKQIPPALSPKETNLWNAVRRIATIAETVMAGEVAEGVTWADFAVLDRLAQLDTGQGVRQRVLAASLGWEKSRISHQLTRMEARTLVRRLRHGKSPTIQMLRGGRAALRRATPGHAYVVREWILNHLSPSDAKTILALAVKLPPAWLAGDGVPR